MARIRPVDSASVGPEAQETFAHFVEERGAVPNMFRTLALREEIMRTAAEHLWAIFNTGTVDPRLKEMLAVRVSQLNDCVYCRTSHTALAVKLGVSEHLLDAMFHIDSHRDEFTPAQLAALAFADRMTTDARNVDENVWAEVREYFDEGQIIEIAAVVGLFNYFNRFNDALHVEITKVDTPTAAN